MIQTSIEQDAKLQIFESFKNLKKSFAGSPPLTLKYRIDKLNALEQNLLKYKGQIEKALFDDFKKPGFETDTSELLTSLVELRKAKRELHKWIRPQTVATPTELTGTNHYIRYEPKGVVLIISPWNYPLSLALIPMIAAWAAGNRIILKPSEFTQHTSLIIKELIRDTFSEDEVMVINGGSDVAATLTQLPFNHIFFTGSVNTAKKILKVTAENLTPVTLELGGKTPVILDEDVNLKSVVKDIVYAKCINAGQTCIAPDFILLPEKLREEFVKEWNDAIKSYYGDNMISNPDYCGIIHEKHYLKLMNMIQDSLDQGAVLIEPISRDSKLLKIKPVLLLNSDWNHASMQEEIFGPVLPVITYKNIQEALTPLQNMNRPLTLYLFSKNQSWIDNILNVVRSGGVTINNCLLNYCNFNLPFGGDQHSGHGVNHGRHGFETFSHKRAVSVQGRFINPIRFFYPPFNNAKIKIKNIALKILGKI
jgi:aldehyde dehydrogenase (NAD+)